MNKQIRWLCDNTLLAMAMVALAAAVAAGSQAREVDAVAYKMLTNQWPRVSAPIKDEIAGAMKNGSVSRWEYTKLFRDIMDDRHGLAFDTNTGSVEEERAKLMKEIERGPQQ